MKASVVILTKNPGIIFRKVLVKVLEQETPWPFEALVIDSGSTDGTIDFCIATKGIRLHQIPPHEFGHGKTRNLGVLMTKGEFIVFLTHDALPENNRWLFELVSATEQQEDIAGAFGRHRAYPTDGPFLVRDLNDHFDGFLNGPPVVKLDDNQRYKTEVGYRQFLHFFSDNNACIRRSVWEKIPYPCVEFAEDQKWAEMVIEAGYAKAYADKAVVFHSHSSGFIEGCRRGFDESRALKLLFGYNLCDSVSQLVVNAFHCIKRDYRYGFYNKIFISNPSWLVKCLLRNFFKQIGYYFGQRSQSLPQWLAVGLSRDRSLNEQ